MENASALLFQTFLSSHSKQALTPKIVTLMLPCHLIEFNVFLQQIIDKDACTIFIETMKLFCAGTTIVLFPVTLFLQALLNPVCSPQCFCQDIFGPFFPFSSSSSLLSPPILFTSFLLSLASTRQCVLESYFTKARDQPLDSLRFQELPHRQFNTKMILRITFYLIM